MDPAKKEELIKQVNELNKQLQEAGTGNQTARRNISDQIWQWNNILKRKKINGEKWGITKEGAEGAATIKFVSPMGESITTDEFIRRTESVDTKVQKQQRQIGVLKAKTQQRRREQEKAKPKIDGTTTVNNRQKKLNALNTDYFTHNWTAAWSDADQSVYYYNTQTGLSQWMDPTPSITKAQKQAKREKDIREKAIKARANRDLRKLTGTTQPSNRSNPKIVQKNQPPPPTNKPAPNPKYQPRNTTAVRLQKRELREKKKKAINNNPHHWVANFIRFIIQSQDSSHVRAITKHLNAPHSESNNYDQIFVAPNNLRTLLSYKIKTYKDNPSHKTRLDTFYNKMLENINSSTYENDKLLAIKRIKNFYDYFVIKINTTAIPKPRLFKTTRKVIGSNRFVPRINDHKFKIYKTPLWVLTQKIGEKDYTFKSVSYTHLRAHET